LLTPAAPAILGRPGAFDSAAAMVEADVELGIKGGGAGSCSRGKRPGENIRFAGVTAV